MSAHLGQGKSGTVVEKLKLKNKTKKYPEKLHSRYFFVFLIWDAANAALMSRVNLGGLYTRLTYPGRLNEYYFSI